MSGEAFGLIVNPCPDCTNNSELHSDPSCPTARAVDDIVEDDAEWFRKHPGATIRRRPTTAAEVAEHWVAGHYVAVTDTCIVTQLRPGLRVRRYVGVAR